jgi:hypothetical protein
MMKKLILPVFICSSLLLASCHRERNCITGGLHLEFQGFDTTSIDTTVYDTITIKSFTANSQFNDEITSDVIILQKYDLQRTTNNGTTSIFLQEMENEGMLRPTHDWEIRFSDKIYRIKGIQYEQKKEKVRGYSCAKFNCYNPFTSYVMNDVTYQNSNNNRVVVNK